MKHSWWLFCSLLAVLALPLLAQEPERIPGVVRFDVRDIYLDTLYFRPDTVFSQSYTFKNVGEAPISFAEVSAGCTCITVDLPEAPVQPGAADSLVVHFDPHWPGNFHHRIGLVTDGEPRVCFISLNIVLLDPNNR